MYTVEELKHWFIPRPGIVDSYVVEVSRWYLLTDSLLNLIISLGFEHNDMGLLYEDTTAKTLNNTSIDSMRYVVVYPLLLALWEDSDPLVAHPRGRHSLC